MISKQHRYQSVATECQEVTEERDAQVKEKEAALEEIQLTLLQLHQVEDELKYYFHKTQNQDDLLKHHLAQGRVMRSTISKLFILSD